jgi:PAS domain S-box-containing protein
VTESRQVESRLRESEERFRSTFEQAAVGMAHVSPEGRWLRVNRKLCDILGYSPERLLQLGLQDITPPEDLPANRQMMERLLTGARETGIVERRCIRADGSLIWAKITIAPFRTPDGVPSHFITVIEDISQEKEMEAQFLRAQRLESVGTLAGGVAHDLNNILAPIIMSVPMLRQDLDEEMRETLVSTIEASAQRGADIVRQILTFTRGIQGDRILLQPLHLLKEVELIARETFPKNIVIRAKYREDVWPVYGDPTQLRQALLNLALNARDATPSGGTVTLGAENIEVDEQYAATHGTGIQPGSYLVWSVSDTGAGIPPEIKDRIFDPFFTTKELGKGTGLGLSTVIGIVRGHGGALWVESGVGEGTTFTIYLPAAPGQVPAAREADGPEILQGNGEMVLVVDDERGVLEMSRLVLERNGYRIATASDGIEGVAFYARHMDEVALVVTDIHMPNFDGLSLVQAIRKLNPRIPIIGSTGQTCDDEDQKLMILGVNRFLRKPYTKRQLLATIRDLL